MGTYGVTSQGYIPKPTQQILADMSTSAQSIIDPLIDITPEEPLGQIFGIIADQLAQLWSLGGTAYNGMSRDGAENVQLDNVNGLTGTKRLPQTPSSVLQTNVFSATGTYGPGSLVINVSGQPQVQFANGDQLVVSGTGPYTAAVGSTILATNATLPITVPGMKFFCTVDGPTIANAGTLTQITTPVSGWSSTTNPLSASPGTLVETDTAYRIRGAEEIAAAGSGTVDSMVADLRQVPGVIQAFCIENNTQVTDSYSNPPGSFLVVIWDGAVPAAVDQQIAQTIWNDKPTGILASPAGTIIDGVALDINNGQHVMPFDRATQELLYVTMTVTMMPGQAFTQTVANAIKQAMVNATNDLFLVTPQGTQAPNPAYLGLGMTVYAEALRGAILNAGLDVLNIPAATFFLGFSPSPGGTADLTVTPLQIAIANTGNILVNGL